MAPVNDCLHDRTLRATASHSGFLIGSSWAHQSLLGQDFSGLFFDGTSGDLYGKAEQIMRSPEAHRKKCIDFAEEHRARFNFSEFLNHLDGLAEAIRKSQQTA